MSVAFKEAVEAKDWERAIECLAPDVTFNSPVAFKPFEGKEAVSGVLRAVSQTFEDFRYTDELASGDADTHILVFRARVGDKELEGIDLLRLNADGQVEDFTVMVRPASGLMALGEAMGPKVASLK
jgi:hypothetical protein